MPALTTGALSRLKWAAMIAGVALGPLPVFASDVTGVWMNDTGRGAIEIKPCGGALCGHVVWVKDGSDAKGCGRQIIGDATSISGNTYGNGWIYSPERKRRYDVEFKPLDDNRLRVIGFAGSKFFSKTMIWKRAAPDLQRCGETVAAAKPVEEAAGETVKAVPVKASAAPIAKAAVSNDPPATSGAAALQRAYAKKAQAKAEAETLASTPAEQAGDATETTEVASAEETGDDAGPEGLGDLKGKLDQYLKRDGDTCKLNLPWVKVNFKCE